jgi:pilus assembly protein CpaB
MISAKSRRWPPGIAMQQSLIRLLLAGGLAAAALVLTQLWMAGRAGAAGRVATVDVLVTARPVAAGSVMAADDLRWQRWPAELAGEAWLVRPDGLSLLVGRVAAGPLPAGVPMIQAMTLAPGEGSSFAAGIRPGRRAVTIAVTPAGGLAGFAEPGDRVDVLLTQAIGNRRTAQTLIADLAVLGVDGRRRGDASPLAAASDVIAEAAIDTGAAPPGLVTLEVTPRQAEALAVAGEMGKLSLVLRGPGREDRSAGGRRWDDDVTGLSVAQLAPNAAPPPAVAAPPVPPLVTAGGGGVEVVYGVAPPDVAEAAPK